VFSLEFIKDYTHPRARVRARTGAHTIKNVQEHQIILFISFCVTFCPTRATYRFMHY